MYFVDFEVSIVQLTMYIRLFRNKSSHQVCVQNELIITMSLNYRHFVENLLSRLRTTEYQQFCYIKSDICVIKPHSTMNLRTLNNLFLC